MESILPPIALSKKLGFFIDCLLEKTFAFLKVAHFTDKFSLSQIEARSACFIEEGRKKGLKFKILRSFAGQTNCFQIIAGKKTFWFEGLPIAPFLNKKGGVLLNNKSWVKRKLKARSFPIAQGKTFYFWQKKKAINFSKALGFPLVVKPRQGSFARHVTTDIKNEEQLDRAIKTAIVYSPIFLIEKFIQSVSVFRATVVDFDFVACVKQEPANIIGNGILTIKELINDKNNDPRRGEIWQKEAILHKIVVDEKTKELISKKGYDFDSIPQKKEIVYLQKDSFLRLGGDLIEVTPLIHLDNLLLFKDIAKFFNIPLVGIDFLAKDISVSWKGQTSAILELNGLPCIELHHFPSSGTPQNVAKALDDMVKKYYV